MKKSTYTQKDEFGRYFLDGNGGKLTSDILGRFYGEAVDHLAELEHSKDDERERLIVLMQDWGNQNIDSFPFESVADFLLANGVHVHVKEGANG